MGQLTPAGARGKNRPYFKAFWDAYPKHTNIGETERVFSEVVEGSPSRPAVDPVMLINKAKAYARNINPDEMQYVPSPHNWLRDGRWEDRDLFTDSKDAEKEWINGCWQRCDVAAVENRLRVKMPRINVPDGMSDPVEIKQWYRRQVQAWITDMGKQLLA